MRADERRRIETRAREVLGSGPRIPPLTRGELTEEALDFNQRIHRVAGRERGPFTLENLPEVIGVMMRHPELFRLQTDVGLFLMAKGELPARDRELVILRVAWLCQAPYQWGEHVLIARKSGIESTEIDAVTEGSGADRWTPDDRAILRAAEELHADATISDETWGRLAGRLTARQLIEIVLLVGQYHQLAFFLNAFRIQLHQGNDGLSAR